MRDLVDELQRVPQTTHSIARSPYSGTKPKEHRKSGDTPIFDRTPFAVNSVYEPREFDHKR